MNNTSIIPADFYKSFLIFNCISVNIISQNEYFFSNEAFIFSALKRMYSLKICTFV